MGGGGRCRRLTVDLLRWRWGRIYVQEVVAGPRGTPPPATKRQEAVGGGEGMGEDGPPMVRLQRPH